MSAQAILAIDLGAESGRASVGVLDGDRLSLHEVHRFLHLPHQLPSGLHWDLMGLWQNVLAGVRKAVAWTKERNLPLASLGVDTWGVDFALLGRSGELLGLPHAYRDERNAAAFEKAIAAVGRERIYEATGIQFMALNTLYQLIAQNEAEPALVAQADRLLFMPDLMHFLMTGRRINEASIASTSQMLDVRTGEWSLDLLEQLGLPTQMLGEILPAGTTIGPLLPEVARETGADADLQVVTPAAHDSASAIAAVPADPATSWCYISSGTWSVLGAELDEPLITDEARQASFTNEVGVGGTIRFLTNITGLWLVQECRRAFEQAGESYDYDELTRRAEQAEPGRTLIDPSRPRFIAPGDMPQKIAAFARETGQPEPRTEGEYVRCCLESLALSYRRTLGRLERVLDRGFDVIHIVGGGSRNALLNQMTANATGRRVVAGPAEATTIGNVLTQALDTHRSSERDRIRRCVAESFTLSRFDPQQADTWDAHDRRFHALLEPS